MLVYEVLLRYYVMVDMIEHNVTDSCFFLGSGHEHRKHPFDQFSSLNSVIMYESNVGKSNFKSPSQVECFDGLQNLQNLENLENLENLQMITVEMKGVPWRHASLPEGIMDCDKKSPWPGIITNMLIPIKNRSVVNIYMKAWLW